MTVCLCFPAGVRRWRSCAGAAWRLFPPCTRPSGTCRASASWRASYHCFQGSSRSGTRPHEETATSDRVTFFPPPLSRAFSDVTLAAVGRQWRQHSQLLADSDFAMVEPIMTARSVAQQTLALRVGGTDGSLHMGRVLTDHLMELCRLSLKAGNTQVRCTVPPGSRKQSWKKVMTLLRFVPPAGGARRLPDEAAQRRVRAGVAVAAGRGSGVLGQRGAGSGSGPPQADDRQPGGQGDATPALHDSEGTTVFTFCIQYSGRVKVLI